MPEAIVDQAAPQSTDNGGGDWFDSIDAEAAIPESEGGDEQETSDEPAESEAGEDLSESDEASEEQDAKPAQKTLEMLAQEYGLNPKDPAHRKILNDMLKAQKRIADSQDYIQTLKGQKPEPDDLLSDFDSLFESEDEAETPPTKQTHPAAKANAPKDEGDAVDPGQPSPVRFNDIGDNWKGPDDYYQQYSEVWAEVQRAAEQGLKPNWRAINELDIAMFNRRAHPLIQSLRMQMARELDQIREQIGPVVPHFQQLAAQQRETSAQQQVVTKIMSDPKIGPVLQEMRTPNGNGLIDVEGQKVPDTPLNRTLAKNPWIMKIKGGTPEETYREQYKAAISMYRQSKQSPTTAKKLVEAGQKIQQKAAADRTRQNINAGRGSSATSAGAPSGGKTSSSPKIDWAQF